MGPVISPARVKATASVLVAVASARSTPRPLAVQLREVRYDLNLLPHSTPDVQPRRQAEILVQLSAAIALDATNDARLRSVLAEIAGWDL